MRSISNTRVPFSEIGVGEAWATACDPELLMTRHLYTLIKVGPEQYVDANHPRHHGATPVPSLNGYHEYYSDEHLVYRATLAWIE
jgi:hypothetical protein